MFAIEDSGDIVLGDLSDLNTSTAHLVAVATDTGIPPRQVGARFIFSNLCYIMFYILYRLRCPSLYICQTRLSGLLVGHLLPTIQYLSYSELFWASSV